MHRDTVIGIVGVVILVAAMVGVFTYERSQASDLGGDDGTSTGNFTASLSGTSPLGEENAEPQNMTVNITGITNMTFTLSWRPGQQTSVDTMRLVVVMPNNMTQESDPEDDGEITLTIPIPADADSAGEWQIVAAFVQADAAAPVVGEPPVQPPGSTGRDTEVSWTLDVQGE